MRTGLAKGSNFPASISGDLPREPSLTLDISELLSSFLRLVIDLADAEGGCATVRRGEDRFTQECFHQGVWTPLSDLGSFGKQSWDAIAAQKDPYLSNDAACIGRTDPRFVARFDVRSVVYIPLVGSQGDTVGFLQLHNKKSSEGFSDSDLKLLSLAAQVLTTILSRTHERGELAFRPGEEQFRLLVEAVRDYAIFMLDPQGIVRTWNRGAERIKGYAASEIIGKSFSCFYPEGDRIANKPQDHLQTALRVGRFEEEGWRIRKDGTAFWANVLITPLFDSQGNLYGFGKVTRDFTLRKHAQESLRKEMDVRIAAQEKSYESERALRELSAHRLQAQEEERKRIGRDLHDSVGQYLAALKMGLSALRDVPAIDRDARIVQRVEECIQASDEASKQVRTISYLLYPPMLEELGLESTISWYLEGFSSRSGIRTDFECQCGVERLSKDIELALFRILQESLANVLRHSGSPTVQIKLTQQDNNVVLCVNDFGKGIGSENVAVPSEVSSRPSVGLRSMVERMRRLGGTFELISRADGATVLAKVPLERGDAIPPET